MVKIIEKNPEVLERLTDIQLEELNKLYDKIIEENNRKINKLKREIA